MNRRDFLMLSGAALSGGASALRGQPPAGPAGAPKNQAQRSSRQQQDIAPDVLLLKDYRPRSIFKIPVTHVEKAKYPVIDTHNHGARGAEGVATTVKVMDAVNVEKTIIFLGRATTAEAFKASAEPYLKYPGRFELWTNFNLSGLDEPGFAARAVAALEAVHGAGCVGIGEVIDKGGGLTGGMNPTGSSMGPHPDDPRLDVLWDRCARLGLPVNLHVSDPVWGYLPMNQYNDGLMNGFKWRLDNKPGIMGHDALIASFEKAAQKHPKTVFIAAHLMNLTYDLTRLGEIFDRHPNIYADISARFWEVAATPRAALRFFQKYPDRVLYGTDAAGFPNAGGPQASFRIFETEDEHFYDWPQYHWPQHGLNLPDPILKKLYRDNALRAFQQARG